MLPRIRARVLNELLTVLGLPVDATPDEAWQAFELKIANEKSPEAKQKILDAYNALTGNQSRKISYKPPIPGSARTVGDYLKDLFAKNPEASKHLQLKASLPLDIPTSFYLYVPISLVSGNGSLVYFDPTAFSSIISAASASGDLYLYSSEKNVNSFGQPPQATDASQIAFTRILQTGLFVDRNEQRYQLPKIIPKFIIYRVDDITPRLFLERCLNGNAKYLLPLVTSYMTDSLDQVSDDVKYKLATLENKYHYACEVYARAINKSDNVLTAIGEEIETFLIGIGKKLQTKKDTLDAAKYFARHGEIKSLPIDSKYFDADTHNLLDSNQFWYVNDVFRYQIKQSFLEERNRQSKAGLTTFSAPVEATQENPVESPDPGKCIRINGG
jgi:hypothetical protein